VARKSRKRRRQRTAAHSANPAPTTTRARPRDERPQAPWGPFPLVEIVVAIALVLLVAGFVVGGARGSTMLVTGLVLGSLAGLELSIREHFAGYRSHSLLLAGAVAIGVLLGLYYLAELSPGVSLVAAAAVFAVSFVALARAFRGRSGRLFKLG
jgi:hypothetical protein